MSDRFGESFRIHLFGESHGPAVGVVIEGLAPGLRIDMEHVQQQMRRRAPGGAFVSARKEPDAIEWISGIHNGCTTGTSVCALIRNQDARSADYDQYADLPRPSHADYTGYVKYKGFADTRGGGHFSARLTAGLVLAGSLAEQVIRRVLPDYQTGSHLLRIGPWTERRFSPEDLQQERLASLQLEGIPLLCQEREEEVRRLIRQVSEEKDSVGGVIETAVCGLPAGLGDPFFDSMESRIAHLAFSIPALKGISFGDGFDLGAMRGSEANDPYHSDHGRILTETNHNGGILGGITTGMPVILQTVMKPTPSIGKRQRTVNLQTLQTEDLEITGRHDPCVALRAVPVIEAVCAIAVCDALLSKGV